MISDFVENFVFGHPFSKAKKTVISFSFFIFIFITLLFPTEASATHGRTITVYDSTGKVWCTLNSGEPVQNGQYWLTWTWKAYYELSSDYSMGNFTVHFNEGTKWNHSGGYDVSGVAQIAAKDSEGLVTAFQWIRIGQIFTPTSGTTAHGKAPVLNDYSNRPANSSENYTDNSDWIIPITFASIIFLYIIVKSTTKMRSRSKENHRQTFYTPTISEPNKYLANDNRNNPSYGTTTSNTERTNLSNRITEDKTNEEKNNTDSTPLEKWKMKAEENNRKVISEFQSQKEQMTRIHEDVMIVCPKCKSMTTTYWGVCSKCRFRFEDYSIDSKKLIDINNPPDPSRKYYSGLRKEGQQWDYSHKVNAKEYMTK